MTSAAERICVVDGLVKAAIGCLALLLVAACSRPAEPVTFSGTTMGTVWTVRVTELPDGVSGPELREQIEAVLEQVNAEMSTYRADSVITAFNQSEAGARVVLPPGFAQVLEEALYWARVTDGAFDPTAGLLVNLWGFGPPMRPDEAPGREEIQRALENVGWWRLSFDSESRELTQPGGVYLDLSAIAKGWGVDQVAEYLGDAGVAGFLVDIGGDLRARGLRPDGQRWRVAIERPRPGARDVHDVIGLEAVALATSGDYRNFFEVDGRRVSHLIDPRTGSPIVNDTVSVTVAHQRCTTADALATALSVLSFEQGWALALERDLAVLWMLVDGDELVERITPAFARLIEHGAL
ncbi:MAG: FAD:protein FMN transferase [Wenzhouxiangella sp.]|nr:MAG: FAD:protein FMN transferase [Wenzhouxiangella sp.]